MIAIKEGVELMEITKEKLEELYWDRELTQKEIGKIFDLTRSTIYYYFKKFNINTRSIGDYNLKSNDEFLNDVQKQTGSEYTFLEKYKGSMIKIKVKHNKCKNIYKVTPNAFLSHGNRCPYCKHTPPFTKEEAENHYYIENLTQKEIGNKYGIADSAVCKWFKKYNIKSKIDTSHITKGKIMDLYIDEELTQKECSVRLKVSEPTIRSKMKKFGIKARYVNYDYDYVKKYFEKNGCRLLSKEYNGYKQKLKYVCECGNKSVINFDNFKQGHRCWKCRSVKISKKNKYD